MKPKPDAAGDRPDIRAIARYSKNGNVRTYAVRALPDGPAQVWVTVESRGRSRTRKLYEAPNVPRGISYLEEMGQSLLAEGFVKEA